MSDEKLDLEKRVEALEARIFDLDRICALTFHVLVGNNAEARQSFTDTLRDMAGSFDDPLPPPEERAALSNNSFQVVAAELSRYS